MKLNHTHFLNVLLNAIMVLATVSIIVYSVYILVQDMIK